MCKIYFTIIFQNDVTKHFTFVAGNSRCRTFLLRSGRLADVAALCLHVQVFVDCRASFIFFIPF